MLLLTAGEFLLKGLEVGGALTFNARQELAEKLTLNGSKVCMAQILLCSMHKCRKIFRLRILLKLDLIQTN